MPNRYLKHPPIRRFDEGYTVDDSGCWVWQGSTNTNGYGKFRVEGKTVYTHRFSYTRFKGPIPSGLTIDHLCRNRLCCNPDHLEVVSFVENQRRRHLVPCPHTEYRNEGRCIPCDRLASRMRTRKWRERKASLANLEGATLSRHIAPDVREIRPRNACKSQRVGKR